MSIYLVQHGRSLPKEMDPDQGLSDQGKRDVRKIAQVAKGYEVEILQIYHSGKKRAAQTAELFDMILETPGGIDEAEGLKPMDDVSVIAEKLDPETQIMVVGHLPFMERLVSHLITGDQDRPVFKFQNAGILCIDKNSEGYWYIKWALMPRIR